MLERMFCRRRDTCDRAASQSELRDIRVAEQNFAEQNEENLMLWWLQKCQNRTATPTLKLQNTRIATSAALVGTLS